MSLFSVPEFEPYGEPSPNPWEIVFPPVFIVTMCMMGLVVLSCRTQSLWWKNKLPSKKKSAVQSAGPVPMIAVDSDESATVAFLTTKEEDILVQFAMYPNRPLILFKIAMPALLSMALCPFSLYMYMPMVNYFWPPSKHSEVPEVNDAIQAFLTPAGLVYAIGFGFAFQEATHVQNMVSDHIAEMVNLCYSIARTCMMLHHIFSKDDRTQIIYILKEEGIIWIRQILAYSNVAIHHTSKLKDVINIIERNQHNLKKPLDKSFVKKISTDIYNLEQLTIKTLTKMVGRMNLLQWVFLEALAYLAFFGVLMVNAFSYTFQVCICIITVFSISMFCYILADLDNPYHGFFRVDLSLLPALMQGLEDVAITNSRLNMQKSHVSFNFRNNGKLSLENIPIVGKN